MASACFFHCCSGAPHSASADHHASCCCFGWPVVISRPGLPEVPGFLEDLGLEIGENYSNLDIDSACYDSDSETGSDSARVSDSWLYSRKCS